MLLTTWAEDGLSIRRHIVKRHRYSVKEISDTVCLLTSLLFVPVEAAADDALVWADPCVVERPVRPEHCSLLLAPPNPNALPESLLRYKPPAYRTTGLDGTDR